MSAVCSGRSLCLHKFIKFQKQNNMVWKSANKDLDRNVIRFVPVLPQTENLMVNLSKGRKQTVTLSVCHQVQNTKKQLLIIGNLYTKMLRDLKQQYPCFCLIYGLAARVAAAILEIKTFLYLHTFKKRRL